MIDPGLLLSFGFSISACVGGGGWCLRRLAQARYLQDTPTSKIRSAAQGYVELYGVLHALPDSSIAGPLSGTPCLWWRFKIEELSGNGKTRSWQVVESATSEGWLRLVDGAGECLINPAGAEVRPSVRQVWDGDSRHPMGQAPGGLLAWLGGKRYRYTEERLHVGQPLYAIGDFVSAGGGRQAFDTQAAQGEVIREWKRDFDGLLQRFDSNRNGRLDELEWNHVRLAASLEAEDRHRQRSAAPEFHRLRRPAESQPFILSNQGEDELASRFHWQALGGALLCMAGALATAYLLRFV
ncbi:GIDE domain-containing protein [Pseudomonas sp.]|uniref:GIDE domain-containing protein n=1 Tax=Pseudomonas sp. TaxID=306 RepID=UPI0028AD4D6B|nr:GIDE domain-containing protein [Pseudomonas sp.]